MKRFVFTFVAFATALAATPARAHDFWLQPESFSPAPQQPVRFELLVGHGEDRQRSKIPLRRILRYDRVGPDGARIDLRGDLALDGDYLEARETLAPGTHVFVLETDNAAHNHMPADQFEAYARLEGLALVLETRKRLEASADDGSEIYRRCAKTIVRVGDDRAAQVSQPVGLTLEIVPDGAPAGAGKLGFTVLFRGAPLPGARIALTDLDHDSAPIESVTSDARGRGVAAIPRSGAWLLNVVWSVPREADADTRFETFFSSLAFGS